MTPYADTNLFTSVYLRRETTEAALALLESVRAKATRQLPVTWLHRCEFANALQLHVFFSRLSAHPSVTPEQALLAHADFRADLAAQEFIRGSALPLNDFEALVEELASRHTAKHGFRTYDLLHVASALTLECDTFWSFDPKATKLAALEGLKVRR